MNCSIGSTQRDLSQNREIADRFWSHVDKENGPVHPTLGRCWQWTAFRCRKGYGRFGTGPGTALAHRISHAMAAGTMPPADVQVRHLCNNASCVNPDHLAAGDGKANAQDRIDAGGYARGEAHREARLSEADVVAIRERRSRGARGVDLAAEFGVHPATITAICVGRLWSHAGGPITAPLRRGRLPLSSAPGATP